MMKTRKKARIAFALMSVVLLVSLSVVQPFAIDAPDFSGEYEQNIDLSTLTVFSGLPTLQDENQWFVSDMRTVFGLGSVDFTNYSEITISYASPPDALFGEDGSYWALLKSADFTDSSGEGNVIAKGSLSNAQGAWFDDIRSSTIDVSGIDYVGEAFLAFYLPVSTLRFMSMDITYKVYLQSDVDDIIKEYINPEVSIFKNCKLNATVNYTLSLVDEGGGYDSYQKFYSNLEYSTIDSGISFKSVYSYIKDDLLGGLVYPDEGYINSVKFDISFDEPVNILALGLNLTKPSNLNLGCSVRYIQTGTPIAYGTILEDKDFYLEIYRDTFTPVGGTTNYTVARIELSLSHKNVPLSDTDDWDGYFINLDASLFQDSSVYMQYSEAYNLGLQNGLERAESDWSVKLYQARKEALAQGQEKGEQIGYDKALKELEAEWQVHYNNGMDAGLKLGFDDGYVKGVEAGGGNKENFSINSLIFSAVDAPVRAVVNFLNFDVLGFNLADLFTGIFTFLLIGLVLFVVVKLLI